MTIRDDEPSIGRAAAGMSAVKPALGAQSDSVPGADGEPGADLAVEAPGSEEPEYAGTWSDKTSSEADYYGSENYYGSHGYYASSYSTGAGYVGNGSFLSPQAATLRRAAWLLGALVALTVAWPGILRVLAESSDATGWLLLVGAAVVGVGIGSVLGQLLATRVEDRVRTSRREEARRAEEAVKEARSGLSRDEVERRQELDALRIRESTSYQRCDRQARSAYRIVQASAATGLALLVVAFAVAVTTSQTSLQIVAASLAAIGTAISAYVGATSLAVWNRALSQLNVFDMQPLIIRQLAAAREVVDTFQSPDRHDAALEKIITTRLSLASDAFSTLAGKPTAGRRSRAAAKPGPT